MNKNYKIVSSELINSKILNRLGKINSEVIDLSELDLFDATKAIVMVSAYTTAKSTDKNFKFKVSTSNIKELLAQIPLGTKVELVR